MFPCPKRAKFPGALRGKQKQPLGQDIEMKFCQSLYSTYYFYYSY